MTDSVSPIGHLSGSPAHGHNIQGWRILQASGMLPCTILSCEGKTARLLGGALGRLRHTSLMVAATGKREQEGLHACNVHNKSQRFDHPSVMTCVCYTDVRMLVAQQGHSFSETEWLTRSCTRPLSILFYPPTPSKKTLIILNGV